MNIPQFELTPFPQQDAMSTHGAYSIIELANNLVDAHKGGKECDEE